MTHHLAMTDEQMQELDRLLQREVGATRMELRRTRNPDFRDDLKRRLEYLQTLLDGVEREMSQPMTTE